MISQPKIMFLWATFFVCVFLGALSCIVTIAIQCFLSWTTEIEWGLARFGALMGVMYALWLGVKVWEDNPELGGKGVTTDYIKPAREEKC